VPNPDGSGKSAVCHPRFGVHDPDAIFVAAIGVPMGKGEYPPPVNVALSTVR
jgi:hypothetical protein